MKFGLKPITLCICFCISSVIALAQGTTCAADGGAPSQGSPVACVTGDGVQVTPASVEAQPEVLPLTPEQRPAAPPVVSYQNGKLSVVAKNSILSDILRAIATKTGAAIDIPESANERVVTQLGPAPARDVMSALLNGSHFNYVMVGMESDPDAVAHVILTAKSGGADSGAAGTATAVAMGRPMVQPRNALQAAIMQPYQEMQRLEAQQGATSDIQPAATESLEPASQPTANDSPAAAGTPAVTTASEAAPADAPSAPENQKSINGAAERTPQQVLQNLYETRRQMMVQQQAPPATPQQ